MKFREFTAGNLKGFRYVFEQGEGLPQHAHTEIDAHITIVAKGRIKVVLLNGDDFEEKSYGPGDAVHFEPGCEHSIMATKDGTVIYNILTGG